MKRRPTICGDESSEGLRVRRQQQRVKQKFLATDPRHYAKWDRRMLIAGLVAAIDSSRRAVIALDTAQRKLDQINKLSQREALVLVSTRR